MNQNENLLISNRHLGTSKYTTEGFSEMLNHTAMYPVNNSFSYQNAKLSATESAPLIDYYNCKSMRSFILIELFYLSSFSL
jgi:hypothetical protein